MAARDRIVSGSEKSDRVNKAADTDGVPASATPVIQVSSDTIVKISQAQSGVTDVALKRI